MKYEFIYKTVFFPEEGILAIGDLHIGYEHALLEEGFLLPENQVKETIKDFIKIFNEIKKRGYKLKKIVFLGDIKHAFGYEWKEKKNFMDIIDFLKNHVDEKDITIIKGNHDTIGLGLEIKPVHVDSGIAFIHGHRPLPEIYDTNIKAVVSGHLHPSITLQSGAKSETYKCFLEGSYGGKLRLILPSFLDFVEGTPINYYKEEYWEDFSIIPEKEIMKFKVHVIGEDEVYEFGQVKDFN